MTDGSPLTGWRVLIPRPVERSAGLVEALSAAGALPEVVELIGIEPPEDPRPLDLAVLGLSRGDYAWSAFTSVNAVDAVVGRAARLAVRPVAAAGTRVAAVGPATARALRAAGLPVDLLPPGRGSAAALAEIFPRAAGAPAVLLPRSDLAPAALPEALTGKGYRVDIVVAYRTVLLAPTRDVSDRLATGGFDAVLFTSPSTVRALTALPIDGRTALGAIGAPTRAAATAAGRDISFVAPEPTAAGLVRALTAHATTHPRPEG